jgi:hypothetical protein
VWSRGLDQYTGCLAACLTKADHPGEKPVAAWRSAA